MFLGKCWLQTYLTQQNHFQDSEEVLSSRWSFVVYESP